MREKLMTWYLNLQQVELSLSCIILVIKPPVFYSTGNYFKCQLWFWLTCLRIFMNVLDISMYIAEGNCRIWPAPHSCILLIPPPCSVPFLCILPCTHQKLHCYWMFSLSMNISEMNWNVNTAFHSKWWIEEFAWQLTGLLFENPILQHLNNPEGNNQTRLI